jgi:hypothetical protein
MTRKQALTLVPLGAVLAVAVVVAHLLLPTASASWTVNRILHHACEAVAALAAVGGIVWIMWPRPKPRRRDAQRDQARRRVFALVGCVVLAVGLAVFAEMHRDTASRSRLEGDACRDLRAVGDALDAYAADHDGETPKEITALAPEYLEREALYYAYRNGPAKAAPPAPGTGQDGPPPTYAVTRRTPRRDGKPHADPVRAYLRPGHAWAPLTVVLERGGRCRIVGEDRVAGYERRRKEGL